ncbi:MAG: branched-chain amino acid transaminase [Candidatus Aenigmarchaeota archaeon]|nr:branched-chain amino acid transaminase [Candidatus Aenigmarchaeota archaeon]
MVLKTTKFIWMDGKFVKWKDAKVHVLTHALHYGTAVFEGIHSYKTGKGTAIFRLDEHIDRLFHSANALSMHLRFTKNQLKNSIKKLIKKNKIGDGYIRPLAYYGYGDVGVFPRNVHVNTAIITVPWEHYYSKDLRVMTSKYERHSEKSTVFGAKISGNYANSVLAMHEARKKGYDEALMLDNEGYVAEGPAENIFLVKNGDLITPDSRSSLHGITRNSIMAISKDMGIDAYEKKVSLNEVKNADELFYCGTATEIAPVVSIDNKKIGNGKAGRITLMIRDKFYSIVRGKESKYKKWLAYAN